MVEFLLFDLTPQLLIAFRKVLEKYQKVIKVPVRVIDQPTDVRQLEGVDIYVSPANSYGWMDGGIDDIYREMFPGVQEYVMSQIRQHSHLASVYDRRVLSIGSALLIDLENIPEDYYIFAGVNQKLKQPTKYHNKKLICAPTMERPHNIQHSPDNVYYAMYAILKLASQLDDQESITIAIPGLGTGVGGLSSDTCAHEMARALVDFSQERDPEYPLGTQIKTTKECYLISPVFRR